MRKLTYLQSAFKRGAEPMWMAVELERSPALNTFSLEK